MDNLHEINSISFTKLRKESKLAKLIQYFGIKGHSWFFSRHFVSVIYVFSPSRDPSGGYILPVQRGRRERWCRTPLLEIPQACRRGPWMEAAQLFREQQAALSLPNWTSVGTSTAGAAAGSHNSPPHYELGNPIFPSVPSRANGSSCLLMGLCQSSLFLPAATFTPKLELI